MDELFLTPHSTVAMPRAYWLKEQPFYSAQVLLIRPSSVELHRLLTAMDGKSPGDYDMEVVNRLYQHHCAVLPHRPYNLLSGEFKKSADQHEQYLGYPPDEEAWDGRKAIQEAKYIHFSDWPLPKPWFQQPLDQQDREAPKCSSSSSGQEDCTDRMIWFGLYVRWATDREVKNCLPNCFNRLY